MATEQIMEMFASMIEENKEQKKQINNLLEVMSKVPGVGAPVEVRVEQAPPNAVIVRSDKIQRMALGLRKWHRVKDFKHGKGSNIREYIKRFEAEISSLKTMVGINDALSKEEYIPLFRDKLDYNVLRRVEQVFKSDPNNIQTWADISVADLHKLMVNEFGEKLTDVSNVLETC